MKEKMKQRRMLNRLLSFILSLSMVLSCLEGLTFRVWAGDDPAAEDDNVAEEPVTEDDSVAEEPVEEDDPVTEEPETDGLVVTEWTSTDSLPNASGDYKLMNNVELSATAYVRGVRVDLDLNGHTITNKAKTNSVYVVNSNGMLTLHNGTIKGGQIAVGKDSNLSAADLNIEKPDSDAIGATDANEVSFYNCTISDSTGFGIRAEGTTKLVIENTVIKGCARGAVYDYNTKATLEGCTIKDNKSIDKGAGIYIAGESSGLSVLDTVITGNKSKVDAADSGAGIYINRDVKKTAVKIGGKTEVYNNYTKDDKASNIYLDYDPYEGADKVRINVNRQLTNEHPIGILTADIFEGEVSSTRSVVFSDYYNLSADSFVCDLDGYMLIHNPVIDHPERALCITKPFNLTVVNGTIGSSGEKSAKVGYGDWVTIKADKAEEGYVFDKWTGMTGTPEEELKSETLKFRMPYENLTMTASYKLEAGHLYSIEVINGYADKTQAIFGETVKVTAVEGSSREVFKRWINFALGSSEYADEIEFADENALTTTFKMPAKNVKVAAEFEGLYEIKVDNGTADKYTAKQGETVTISANEAPRGFVFDKWTCGKPGVGYTTVEFADETAPTTTFIMKSSDVNPVATYKEDSFEYWDVVVIGGIADLKTAREGEKVTIKAMPAPEGEVFKSWYTEDEGIVLADPYNPSTTFEMPAHKVTLEALFDKAYIAGGYSALDPVPADLSVAKEFNLVQGQKFTIGSDWTIVDKKNAGKYISISKKGLLKAKKVTPESVTISQNVTGRTVTVNICKPEIDKKLQLEAGSEAKEIGLRNAGALKVYWISSNPDVATVDSGFVKPVAKGKATVTAYINGSAYKCTVTVKEPIPVTYRTIHMNADSKKSISIKGVNKKTVWSSTDENVAKASGKKITSGAAGTAKLSTSVNGVDYSIDVTSENITMTGTGLEPAKGKNKYNLTLSVDQGTDLAFASVAQPVVFKSSKPDIAFMDENGHVVARAEGKAKFTAKVNGKSITITVVVKP